MSLTGLFGLLVVALKRHKNTLAERINIIATGSRADDKGFKKAIKELTGGPSGNYNEDHPAAPKIIIE